MGSLGSRRYNVSLVFEAQTSGCAANHANSEVVPHLGAPAITPFGSMNPDGINEMKHLWAVGSRLSLDLQVRRC
jgi:hypothetical protein